MPIARRVERRGAGLGDATDATNARASRRFSEDANARNDGGLTRRARDEDGDADDDGDDEGDDANGTTRATGGGGRRARERRAVGCRNHRSMRGTTASCARTA